MFLQFPVQLSTLQKNFVKSIRIMTVIPPFLYLIAFLYITFIICGEIASEGKKGPTSLRLFIHMTRMSI